MDPESEAPSGVNFRLAIQKSALDPDSDWIPTQTGSRLRFNTRGSAQLLNLVPVQLYVRLYRYVYSYRYSCTAVGGCTTAVVRIDSRLAELEN
jgi:hypothetical protein